MTVKKIKNCSKCGVEYPATSEYFRKSAICIDGISNVCKKCVASLKKEWRKNTGQYKKGPRQDISFEERYQNDPLLRRAMILRQGIISKQTLCPCCKVLFDYESLLNGTKNNASPSADRFNNSKGYIKDNVVIICWRCNNLKRDTSIEELKTVINWLEGKYENN